MASIHPSRAGLVKSANEGNNVDREQELRRRLEQSRGVRNKDNDESKQQHQRTAMQPDANVSGTSTGWRDNREQLYRDRWSRDDRYYDPYRSQHFFQDRSGVPPPGAWNRQRNVDKGSYSMPGGGGGGFFENRQEQRKQSSLTIWPPSPTSPFRPAEDDEKRNQKRSSSSRHKSRSHKHSGHKSEREKSHRSRRHTSQDGTDNEQERKHRHRSRRHESEEYHSDSEEERRARRRRRQDRDHREKESSHRKGSASPSSRKRRDDGEDEEERRRRQRRREKQKRESEHGERSDRHGQRSSKHSRHQDDDDEMLARSPSQGQDEGGKRSTSEQQIDAPPPSVSASLRRQIGPQMPVKHDESEEMNKAAVDGGDARAYGKALLPGEGSAMANFVQDGQRIPRRGEIGLSSSQIEAYEGAGFVMSGSRHQRMNAVRMRKENQVYSAEEQRAMLKLIAEEKQKKEVALIEQFKDMVDSID